MKLNNVIRALAATVILYGGQTAYAMSSQPSIDQASQSPQVDHTEIYKITDGYGEYGGQGHTKIEAQSQARESCITSKINSYESKHGVTPDADTADMMIDACINK